MQYDAKQLRESALPPKGRYRYRVLETREKTSMSGNDMFNLKLNITINSRDIKIFDSLLLIPSMFWKFEHFCHSSGMPERIESGDLMAYEIDGKEGYLEISHRTSKETGELEAHVKDYVKRENLTDEEKIALGISDFAEVLELNDDPIF